jgi:UDP-N-acetylglucosamine--N-acetylmuramyl-(pentapeptide) pyrophosphoryl-undecaprenol N-acetylglucosamine transferase
MPEAYEVADLVISRAGALSCSELALTRKPSILVPSPNVAGDHQTKNARAMVQEGAAELIKDDELSEIMATLVKEIITDQQRLQKMSKAAEKLAEPDAAQKIANDIVELTKKQNNFHE